MTAQTHMYSTWENAERDHSRGRDVATSKAAFKRARPAFGKTKARILQLLRDAADGLTLIELEGLMDKPRNTFSGRLTWLREAELIYPYEVRGGCTVWRLTEKGRQSC